MSKNRQKELSQVKKIAQVYIQQLEQANIPVSTAYLFGSFAKGNFHNGSDIDIAIISEKFKRQWDKHEQLLWSVRRNVDVRIEPIGYSKHDFNAYDPLIQQIKATGIKLK